MSTPPTLHTVDNEAVREWLSASGDLGELARSIGRGTPGGAYLDEALGVPLHLRFVVTRLAAAGELAQDGGEATLASLPFYSLCKGLFLPLSGMAPERVAFHFGVASPPPLDVAGREALLVKFLVTDLGLSLAQKLGCILGDPFRGRPSGFQREAVMRLVSSLSLTSRRAVVDRLAVAGDVAVLLAETRPRTPREELPPLTAAEVLETLRFLPDEKRTIRYDVLRSLLERMSRLEAFFLAKLLLRKAGFGYDYQGTLLARALASRFGAVEAEIEHAIALTDVFHVASVLEKEGAAGLRRIQLQPLVAIRPALAGGTTDEIARFPVWVERKYDGIRLMLHKSTDARGGVLSGAYTRTRGDWLELVRGLPESIRALPCRDAIVDGELYGTVIDPAGDGPRPATVYDVHAFLQGDRGTPVALRYAAFDLLFLDGQDLTQRPLTERRRLLTNLVGPIAGWPLPVPIALSDGQLAASQADVNRLYNHFRAQGHEGVIAKDPAGTYRLNERDPTWLKRKPEITLDLVLLGAVFAVTSKERVGTFGSYVIGGRNADGGYDELGDVAGVDRARDADIQAEILREGLLTGRRIERRGVSGTSSGVELRPHIVVTVKFEGIARDLGTGKLALRSPTLAYIRSDKSPSETDGMKAIEDLYLKQRVG